MTVEPYLAALVWKTRRPVRMVWTRQESLLARQKRHPFVMHYRTGVTRRRDASSRRTSGSSATPAPTRCSRRACCSPAGVNATGPYRSTNARVESTAVVHATRCRPARCAGSARCRSCSPTSRRWTGSPRRSGSTRPRCASATSCVRGDRARDRRGDRHRASATGSACDARARASSDRATPDDPTRRARGSAAASRCSMQPYGRSVFFADRASCLDRARAGRDDGRSAPASPTSAPARPRRWPTSPARCSA